MSASRNVRRRASSRREARFPAYQTRWPCCQPPSWQPQRQASRCTATLPTVSPGFRPWSTQRSFPCRKSVMKSVQIWQENQWISYERTSAYRGGASCFNENSTTAPRNSCGLHSLHRRRFPCDPRYFMRYVRQIFAWFLLVCLSSICGRSVLT